MTKRMALLCALGAIALSCTKEDIVPSSSSNTGTVDNTEKPATDVQDNTGDDINNTVFSGTISISWGTSGVTVSGDTKGVVSVDGNHVTAKNATDEDKITYVLSGECADGSFTLYSGGKQALKLSGLSLANPAGAAINNQSGKRTFIVLEGVNTLSDGAQASYTTTGEEDMKAVLFSEGQLVFSGTGSLAVNALNSLEKSGIVSDDYVHFTEGSYTVSVTAGSGAGHGVRGKDYVQITGGKVNVSVAAAKKKGIGSDNYVLVEGGETVIDVSGGVAYDSDDKEYKGSAGIKADNYFSMTGGSVTITNTGAGGKGVSAGSYEYYTANKAINDSQITGGILTVKTSGRESNDVSSKGIKIGFKEGSARNYLYAGNLKINGGTIVVNCSGSEGLEAKGNLTFNGGDTYVYSSADDAINCQGDMTVNGGYVYAWSTQNDAMDSNGDMILNGGVVFAVCTKGSPEVALDANSEENKKLYINSGATVIAYGGLESGYSSSQSVYSISCSAGAWNALYGSGSYLAAFKAPSGVSSVAVSAPGLEKGYTGVSVSGASYSNASLATDGISGGTETSLGQYSGGGGPGGGNPGGGGPGRPR